MFEQLKYEDQLSINIKICNVTKYPLHHHDDIQLLYVMRGFVDLQLTCNTYRIEEDNIHFIHANDLHGISHCSENNIIIVISLNTAMLLDKYPDLLDQIFTTKVNKNLITYQRMIALRNDIFTILSELYEKFEGYKLRINSTVTHMIDNLYDNFRSFRVDVNDKTFEHTITNDVLQTDRISRIVNFIHKNYPYKVSLDDIAKKEHLNRYYLSHLFNQLTGQSFKNFVNMVRVEESEKLLLSTDISITQLAAEVGFSKPQYYIDHFIKWYGMKPKEYREINRKKTLIYDTPVISEISLDTLSTLIDEHFNQSNQNTGKIKTINVNEHTPTESLKNISITINENFLSDSFLSDLFYDFQKRTRTANYVFEQKIEFKNTSTIIDLYRDKYSPSKDIENFIKKLIQNKKQTVPFFDNENLSGMITVNGLIKPLYYLVRFAAMLKGELLYSDHNGIITKKENDYAWMFFNNSDSLSLSYDITFPLYGSSYKFIGQSMENPAAFYEAWHNLEFQYHLTSEDKMKINQCTGIYNDFKLIDCSEGYKVSLHINPAALSFGTLTKR